MKKLFVACVISAFVLGATAFTKTPDEKAKPTHEKWDALVTKYVTASVNVNYKGFKTDKDKLDEYCKYRESNPPQTGWTTNEKKAYWINAYNAFTIRLVVKHYPVKSIRNVVKAGKPWNVKVCK